MKAKPKTKPKTKVKSKPKPKPKTKAKVTAAPKKAKAKTKTPITELERCVLAAVLGGSNMGLGRPTRDAVQKLLAEKADLNRAIYALWSRYMDDDATEKGFVDECRWWFRDRDNLNSPKVTREYVADIWPDVAALMW